MRTVLCLLLFIGVGSCNRQSPVKASSKPADTLVKRPETIRIEKILAVLKEKDLKEDTTGLTETRFYFFQPLFKGLFEFYRLDYADSTLHMKQFTQVDPAGMGEDSVYSSKTIRLTGKDLQKIKALLDRSMFWDLKTLIESDNYLDADTYIYESVRLTNNRKRILSLNPGPLHDSDHHRHYHLVYSYAPTNSDFVNFGQFLRLKAGQKNSYHD